MRADRVEFSWDEKESSWLIRIQTGEAVIQRHCGFPKSADEPTLRKAAEKTVADEGYEIDPKNIIRGQAHQT